MSTHTYDISHGTLEDLLGSHDALTVFGNFDTIVGGSGSNDLFAAIGHHDSIVGGSGAAQTLFGSEADDSVWSGIGGDTIAGDATAYIGLAGNDTILGADAVYLGHADNHVATSHDKAGDLILHFSDSGQVIQVDQRGIEIHFAGGGTLKS